MLRQVFLFIALGLSLPANAVQRSFVSTTGSDANTSAHCSNTSPCRGFAAALYVTDAGGEIVVLASGGCGPVTITKSVSSSAPEGVYAGISVTSAGTHGITISTAGVEVILRRLTINGLAPSAHGVYMDFGDKLTIENCTIRNFSSSDYSGVLVRTAAQVRIADSTFQENDNGVSFSSGATATLSRIHLQVSDSLVAKSTGVGIHSASGILGSRSTVSRSEIVENGTGLEASIGGTVTLTGNTIARDGIGLKVTASGVFDSASDNIIRDNATYVSGAIASFGKI